MRWPSPWQAQVGHRHPRYANSAVDALDSVRRQVWQSARRYPDKAIAKKYKGAR